MTVTSPLAESLITLEGKDIMRFSTVSALPSTWNTKRKEQNVKRGRKISQNGHVLNIEFYTKISQAFCFLINVIMSSEADL